MKNRFMTLTGWLVMAAALTAGMTACSSDDNIADEPTPTTPDAPKTYTMTVIASKSADEATTRALSTEGKTLNATWGEGEHVAVYVEVFNGQYQLAGTLSPVTLGSATTTLSGEVTINEQLDLQLVYIGTRTANSSMIYTYTGQNGDLDYLALNFDYASATIPAYGYSISNSDNTISTSSPVSFTNEQAIVRFNLKYSDNSPLSVTDLTVSPALSSVVYGAEFAPVPGDLTISKGNVAASSWYVALRGVKNKTLTLTADDYQYTHENVTFEHGKYYEITVKINTLVSKNLNLLRESNIGWLVGSDGKAYNVKEAMPSDVTVRAVVGYVSTKDKKGYAFALEDASTQARWKDASAAISSWGVNNAISGQTWKLLGKDPWYEFIRNYNGNTLLTNAGGSALSEHHWTGTEFEELTTLAYCFDDDGSIMANPKINGYRVRAGIEFDLDQ